jgi:transcription initiation factor TFIIIB Brf1 subunit/transcription initiation factor TFIIB
MDIFEQFDQLHSSQPNQSIQPSQSIQPQTQPQLENKSQLDECEHKNVTLNQGYYECLDCGLQLTENKKDTNDFERCWVVKKTTRGLCDDVKHCNFPQQVVAKANDIFNLAVKQNEFRINRRRTIVVACIVEAYKMLDIPFLLKDITAQLPTAGENPLAGSEIIEPIVKAMDTNRERNIYNSPLDSAKELLYAHWQNWDDVIVEIGHIFNQVGQKSKILNTARPKSVAAGMIYYYILINDKKITSEEFAEKSKLSFATIKKMTLEVATILGKKELIQGKLK